MHFLDSTSSYFSYSYTPESFENHKKYIKFIGKIHFLTCSIDSYLSQFFRRQVRVYKMMSKSKKNMKNISNLSKNGLILYSMRKYEYVRNAKN